MNGSFDHPRTAAEKFHNDWSLNIEFDAIYVDKSECAKRGELTWGQSARIKADNHWANCYEPISDAQIEAGKKVIALLSQKYNIPAKLPFDVKNQEDYVSQETNILALGSHGKFSANPINMQPGVLPSFWTARSKADLYGKDPKNGVGNHDDGPSWNDLKKLGIIGDVSIPNPPNAIATDVEAAPENPEPVYSIPTTGVRVPSSDAAKLDSNAANSFATEVIDGVTFLGPVYSERETPSMPASETVPQQNVEEKHPALGLYGFVSDQYLLGNSKTQN